MYIVKNRTQPIYYTYWLIHHLSDTEKMYYHGVRTENKGGVDIRDVEEYHGSSNVVNALYKIDSSKFEKRIERIFNTKQEAAAHEERVHYKLDVAHNDRFYNLRNGWRYRTMPDNLVTAKVNGKNVSLKKEMFDLLKLKGLAVGIMSKTVTCIDLNTGKKLRIPEELFYSNKSRYVGVTSGMGVYYNEETGVTKSLQVKTVEGYPWVKYTAAFKQYRPKDSIVCDQNELKMLHIKDPLVISGEYVSYCSDMITVYDKVNDKHFNLHKSDPRIGTVYPTSASVKQNKDMVAVFDENLIKHTMKLSLINEDYIQTSNLRLKLKAGKSVNLLEYDHSLHDVITISIDMLDEKTNEVIRTLNTDKRLLQFKRYRKIKIYYNACTKC